MLLLSILLPLLSAPYFALFRVPIPRYLRENKVSNAYPYPLA